CRIPQRRANSCPQLSIIDRSCTRQNRLYSLSVTDRDNLSSSMHQYVNSTLENDGYQRYSLIKNDNDTNSPSTRANEKTVENSFSISEMSEFDSNNLATCSNDTPTVNSTAYEVSSSTNWVQRLPADDAIWIDDDNSFLLFLCIS